MTAYLITHFKISILFFIIVYALSKTRHLSNRIQLSILYLLLVKSLLPWGFFSADIGLFQKRIERANTSPAFNIDGFSIDSGFLSTAADKSNILIAVWISVFLIILLVTLGNLLRINREMKASSLCDDPVIQQIKDELNGIIGFDKKVLVRVSERISSPVLWWNMGWVIVLPETIHSMNQSKKRIILAHELIHIRKHDFAKFLLLRVIRSLFFFSPFVIFVMKEILSREETETDLKAIAEFGIRPFEFGETILVFAGFNNRAAYPVPNLVNSEKNRLKLRIERLFQKKSGGKFRIGQTLLFLSTVLIFLINFSSTAFGSSFMDSGTMLNPLPEGRLTLGFGIKEHPIYKKQYNHNGIDLAAETGTPILAADDGTVVVVDYDEKMGEYIIIQHGAGLRTIYAHLDEVDVKTGVRIKKGKRIGTVGETGLATGPHLHFEIRKGNMPVDPTGIVNIVRNENGKDFQ